MAGLVDERSIRTDTLLPNGNDPASVPPATVGPIVAVPGDASGFVSTFASIATPIAPPPVVAPWSGWPAEWNMPRWSAQLDELTDVAWSCVDLNASILATMPPYLVGASPNLPTDWLYNPNPDLYTSWEEFAKQLFWTFQLGETFILATAYYANGLPARFHVVPPWYVNADMVRGRRRYTIGSTDVTADLLHIRYTSSVGDAHGHGPLEAGHARLVAARLLGRYATNMAASGGIPNSVLTYADRELTAEESYNLQTQWVTARMSSMGMPAVLSGGVKFETLQFSPKDMALLDLEAFNSARVAVLLGVPPFLVGLPSGGDSMTYSNVSSLFDYHWRASLRPKAQTVMAALSAWLTPRGTRIEVNRDAYVQPGPLERAQYKATLFGIVDPVTGQHAMTVDEIRNSERFDEPTSIERPGVLQ